MEMADANGLMRLMTAEKGQESPMEKYIRFKNNINLWYNEMRAAGLSAEEQASLEPYFLKSYGVPPSQEQLMMMLMDENICGFSLAEANTARKIVGKKQMSKIPELKQKVLSKAKSKQLGQYVWTCGIGPQMGYSFSIIHALAYSFIGFQTMFIATHWNSIYWNTACLIVNSSSLEEDDEYEVVETNEDVEVVQKKEKGTDYAKTAKALSEIISHNINVSLVDINKSNYSFEPDVENNQILFGMKALGGINSTTIEQIIKGRPYKTFYDFLDRCPLNKTAMISLIKSGAFDNLIDDSYNAEPRYVIMALYLLKVSDLKKRLTLQNFNGLIQRNLIPQSLEFQKQVFLFNKYLKAYKKVGSYYALNKESDLKFYSDNFSTEKINVIDGVPCLLQTDWDKIYKKEMDKARQWLTSNQEQVLKEFNDRLFFESWSKYATGSLSAWEMDSLCFYYHEHELANVNVKKYGISNFFDMPEKPVVDRFFKRNGKEIPIYKTYKIVGTVISKNDTRSSITLLTPQGIVNVKFTKEYFANFNRQISEVQEDGTKKIKEKGWFTRGAKVMCTGFRREDTFVGKTYANTATHQLYLITDIDQKGNISLKHERYEN